MLETAPKGAVVVVTSGVLMLAGMSIFERIHSVHNRSVVRAEYENRAENISPSSQFLFCPFFWEGAPYLVCQVGYEPKGEPLEAEVVLVVHLGRPNFSYLDLAMST